MFYFGGFKNVCIFDKRKPLKNQKHEYHNPKEKRNPPTKVQ